MVKVSSGIYCNINKNFNSLTIISIDESHVVSSLGILLQLGDRDALVPSGLGTVEGHLCRGAIGVGCLEGFAVATLSLAIIEREGFGELANTSVCVDDAFLKHRIGYID